MGRGERHDDDLVGVEAKRLALCGHDADDAKTAVADPQLLAQRRSPAVSLPPGNELCGWLER
jgi:hypothetical protein